jgi:hypothetical protein
MHSKSNRRETATLPVQHSQRTKIPKIIYERVPCHWRYCNKTKRLYIGQRPSFIPKNKIVTKKELRHYNHLNSYVNPIVRAKEYLELLKKEGLTQSKLAQKIGVSRVRVTQFLNLLKLPKREQSYILKHGKERLITERAIRKGVISARGVQKL